MLIVLPVEVRVEIEKQLSHPSRVALASTCSNNLLSYKQVNATNLFWKSRLEALLTSLSAKAVQLSESLTNWHYRYIRFKTMNMRERNSPYPYETIFDLFASDALDAEIAIASGLLDEGVNSYTAMKVSAVNGKVDNVKLLLEHEDYVKVYSKIEYPIYSATCCDNLEIFRLLIPFIHHTTGIDDAIVPLIYKGSNQLVMEIFETLMDELVYSFNTYIETAAILGNRELFEYLWSRSNVELQHQEFEYVLQAAEGVNLLGIELSYECNVNVCKAYLANQHINLFIAFMAYCDMNVRDDIRYSGHYIALCLKGRSVDYALINEFGLELNSESLQCAFDLCDQDLITDIVEILDEEEISKALYSSLQENEDHCIQCYLRKDLSILLVQYY